ncbi:MAG: methionine gamma-lyase family protein, partial [Candidatus Cybelea sp.]
MIAELCERFGITGRVKEAALEAQRRTATLTYDAQQCVQRKVLAAFIDEGIDESDLAGTTGYGYDDAARARYEALLA